MNASNTKKRSKTDWERIDAMTDKMIDVSDIPPLTNEFFAKAKWRMPVPSVAITVSVEPDILEWYKAQGDDYGFLMAAALRIYAEAHKNLMGQSLE
ncbi:MAG: BrnA antitoxin family protein [bacterium]|nr:BrnA antitoxin family protein [bacterium]